MLSNNSLELGNDQFHMLVLALGLGHNMWQNLPISLCFATFYKNTNEFISNLKICNYIKVV